VYPEREGGGEGGREREQHIPNAQQRDERERDGEMR